MIYREYLKAKNQNSIKFKEVEGPSPLSIFHSKGRDLKNYQIYGNSTQKTTGKNLISSLPYYNPIPDDNFHVIFEAGKAYTFSFESSTSSKWRLMIWGTELDGSDLNVGSNGYLQGMYCSAAAPNRLQDSADRTTNSYTYLCNKSFVAVRIAFWNTDNGASDTITNPQLELGSTATDYEAYHMSPSPDFPSEIESVGDLTTKNLLDYTTVSTRSGTTAAFIDNGFVYTGNYYFSFDGSFLEIGNTYVMSWNFEGDDTLTPTWRLQYEDGTYSSIVRNGVSLKIAQSVSKILVYPEMSKTTYTTTFTNIQLELGSTVTGYEPYHKYDVPISIYGKNLIKYPYQYTTRDINGIRFTDNGDGSVTMNGKATANAIWFMYLNRTNLIGGLSSGDKITLSVKSNKSFSGALRVVCNYFDTGGTEKDANMSITAANSSITNRITALWKGMEIYIVVLKGQTVDNITIYPQLEKGSPATSYEPYKGKTTTHIYLDEPLRKVGDYADYIDFKNQKVVRNVGVRNFNGSETMWSPYTSNMSNGFYIYLSAMKSQNLGYGLCNYYSRITTSTNMGIKFGANNQGLYFCQVYTSDNPLTVDDWKAKLAKWNTGGNPLIVYYILATPTEESISLPTLKTVKGTSIMSVDTSIKPSNMKIKYIRV